MVNQIIVAKDSALFDMYKPEVIVKSLTTYTGPFFEKHIGRSEALKLSSLILEERDQI